MLFCFDFDKGKQMRNFTVGKVFVATLLAISAGMASAATDMSDLTVSANVDANCTIETTEVAFGTFDPVADGDAYSAGGKVSIRCTKGTIAKIGLDLGANTSGTTRRMSAGGSNYLAYELFQPASNAVGAACAYTTVWGNTVDTDTLNVPPAPSKAVRDYNVCGRILASEDPAPGNYSDTVVATVNF